LDARQPARGFKATVKGYMMMKHTATSIAALMTAFLATSAFAADVRERGGSLKDPDMAFAAASPTVNWSGFYIGGQAGYGKAQHDVEVREFALGKPDTRGCKNTTTLAVTPNPTGAACGTGTVAVGSAAAAAVQVLSAALDGIGGDGFIGGGRVGYDHAIGRFVLGVFGEYNFSNIESTLDITIGSSGANFSLEKENEWSVGGRAGIIVAPRTLAYVLAAYTESDYSLSGTGIVASTGFNPDHTLSGLTVGGGVEYAVSSNIFLGIEGLYTAYDEENWLDDRDINGNGTTVDVETDELKVMGTLKVKFGGAGSGFFGD
jgi:opacity protein-like surface antigen